LDGANFDEDLDWGNLAGFFFVGAIGKRINK